MKIERDRVEILSGAASGFTLRHGEVVSIGMVARTAVALGLCNEAVEERLCALLQRFSVRAREDFRHLSVIAPSAWVRSRVSGGRAILWE